MGLTRSIFFVLSVILSVQGCSRHDHVRPISGNFLHNEFKRDAQRWSKPKPERPVPYDVASYVLRGQLDWETKRLAATVAIRLRWTNEDLKDIDLDSQVMAIHSVKEEGGKALDFAVEESVGILKVELDSLSASAKEKKEATIVVAYDAQANVDPQKEPAALQMIARRAGDVAKGRVAFTSSEPRGAEQWMPCHNVPSDRAAFSAEFSMDASESLISNGDLITNEVHGGHRKMKYATSYTIPTYLMAFALGDFVSHTEFHGALPVSVWARRGVVVDYHGLVQETIRELNQFEKLLTPFPFEKYAVVLLPEFLAGGIEHASISFVSETRTNEPGLDGDRNLNAHELAHQWFGDYMTLESWNDLWVKEGMATLLAEEARRPWEDHRGGRGRLFGRTFYVEDGMAMRDTTLAAEDKYTSGPYGRSAWFMTQLRTILGEKNFWGTLRKILRAHAFSSISGEEFIKSFTGVVSGELRAQMRLAIVAHKMPSLNLHAGSLTLTDIDHSLLAPFIVSWYAVDGMHSASLEVGNPMPVPTKDVMYVIDPGDGHAWPWFGLDDDFKKTILPLQVPRDAKERAELLSAGGGAQLAALRIPEGWTIRPEEFAVFYAGIGSQKAKLRALQVACHRGKTADAAKWSAVLAHILTTPPYLALSERSPHDALGVCRGVINDAPIVKELEKIAHSPAKPGVGFAHLAWLAAFATDAPHAFTYWSGLATDGPTTRARMLGLTQLLKHVKALPGYEAPTGPELVKWKNFFREVLNESDVGEILVAAMDTVAAAKDVDALPRLAEIVRTPEHVNVGRDSVCAAEEITGGDGNEWKAFVKALRPLEDLSAKTRSFVEHPEKCDQRHIDLGDDD